MWLNTSHQHCKKIHNNYTRRTPFRAACGGNLRLMQDHAASRERQILLSARCHLSANVCGAPKSSRTFSPWQVAGCKRWKQSLKSNAIPVSPCYFAWPCSRLKWKSYVADLAPRPGKRPVVDEGNWLSRPAKRLEHYLSPNSTGSARIGLLSFAYGVCSVLGSRLVLAAIIHQGKLSSCPTLNASVGKKASAHILISAKV